LVKTFDKIKLKA